MRSAVDELVLLENPQSLAVIFILNVVGLDRTSTQGTHPILLHEAPSDNVQGWLPDTVPFRTSPLRRQNLCILRGIHPFHSSTLPCYLTPQRHTPNPTREGATPSRW